MPSLTLVFLSMPFNILPWFRRRQWWRRRASGKGCVIPLTKCSAYAHFHISIFSLFSWNKAVLQTAYYFLDCLLSHDFRIFTKKMTKKVPVLIGSLICCCLLDKVYAIDHSFVEGLDTNLHKIHRSLLQDDTGKFTWCDFTYFSSKFTWFPFPVISCASHSKIVKLLQA